MRHTDCAKCLYTPSPTKKCVHTLMRDHWHALGAKCACEYYLDRDGWLHARAEDGEPNGEPDADTSSPP